MTRTTLSLALVLAACSGAESSPDPVPPPEPAREPAEQTAEDTVQAPDAPIRAAALTDLEAPTAEQLGAFAAASNAFAIDLYAKARDRDGNLVFSPASIELAFGMTWAGARGETAQEMQRVLHIESSPEALHESASRILAAWNDPDRQSYELRVVNRLFGERSYTFEPSFLELTRTRYGAPLEGVDFMNAAEVQRARINGWVEDQTNERIDELLPAGSLDARTRLVLVNAVYFLGTWKHAFQESATREEPFHLSNGGQTNAHMMKQVHRHQYAEVEGAQVLQMPYEGDELAMMLVLPEERDGLAALEESLSTAEVTAWVEALRERRVEIHLPRFQIRDARLPLTEMLPEMGMPLAFSDAADFTGMADPDDAAEQLHISDAFHEAFIEVNEEGTEAAAATAVVMAVRGMAPSPPPPQLPVFKADHPFLFFIRDLSSGTILFIGRVTQPSA